MIATLREHGALHDLGQWASVQAGWVERPICDCDLFGECAALKVDTDGGGGRVAA